MKTDDCRGRRPLPSIIAYEVNPLVINTPGHPMFRELPIRSDVDITKTLPACKKCLKLKGIQTIYSTVWYDGLPVFFNNDISTDIIVDCYTPCKIDFIWKRAL